jgi:ubiquinone/menaquinone biosynthesis C-methylase UbiE
MKDYKKAEIEYEKKIAQDYNCWYHSTPIAKAHDRDFVNYLKKEIQKGDRVLDLGCGPASLWSYLTKIKGIELVGADISAAMIKEAKKLYPQGKFMVANAEKLPFKNEEFEVVICSSALHHLPSPQKAFKEIRRILKPYGKLIGREPQNDQFVKETSPSLSGAIMSLMHMIYRRQKTVIIKEPKIHQFHHAFDIRQFVDDLASYFVVHDIVSKFPFSSLFMRVGGLFLGRIILQTDKFLSYYKGDQFFYKAVKDGYDRIEVLANVNGYLRELEKSSQKPPLKFVKRLIWLSIILDLILPKK